MSTERNLEALDPGPMARLEELKRDPAAPSVIFQRLTAEEPETLGDIAKSWNVTRGRFIEWYMTEHAALYESALKVRADKLAHDALKEAKDASPEDVGVRKLRANVSLKVAGHWDRTRYGEKPEPQKQSVNVWVMRLPAPAATTGEWVKSIESRAAERQLGELSSLRNVLRALPESEVVEVLKATPQQQKKEGGYDDDII